MKRHGDEILNHPSALEDTRVILEWHI